MENTDKTLFLVNTGNRIRNEREYLGMTREKFAEFLNLSPFYIGQIERGDRGMSLETLIKISDTLKLSIDYILRGEDFDLYPSLVLESMDKYCEEEACPELKEVIEVISRLPKEKIPLIRDITKMIIPHIK